MGSEVGDQNSNVQRLVGQFLQSFAKLERALNSGIGKILGHDDRRNDIICFNIPFAKKVDVFFSAENYLAAMPDEQRKELLRITRSQIMALNDIRVMFAHNEFFPDDHGNLTFSRVVAKTKLSDSIFRYTNENIDELCENIDDLCQQLGQLVDEMEPYQPSLDSSDPRNSGLMLLFI